MTFWQYMRVLFVDDNTAPAITRKFIEAMLDSYVLLPDSDKGLAIDLMSEHGDPEIAKAMIRRERSLRGCELLRQRDEAEEGAA